jgi:hypothetical protein
MIIINYIYNKKCTQNTQNYRLAICMSSYTRFRDKSLYSSRYNIKHKKLVHQIHIYNFKNKS